MKNIYLIVGPSGSGKTSIANLLEERYGLKQLISYTTRPQRSPKDQSHIFISDEEFDKLENICGYTLYHDHRYAATDELVDQADIYVIDPPGVDYLLKHYHGKKNVKVIALDVSETIRAFRMMKRGDTVEQILQRLELDAKHFQPHLYKYIPNCYITELNLEKAIEEIYTWIEMMEK